MGGAPLGNDQLATALFFERHSLLKGDDCTLRLLVRWRLRGDTLQPKPRRRHQRKQGTAMFGGKTDDLIRDSGDHRQKDNSGREASPERGVRAPTYKSQLRSASRSSRSLFRNADGKLNISGLPQY